jgi:hypothetical protein
MAIVVSAVVRIASMVVLLVHVVSADFDVAKQTFSSNREPKTLLYTMGGLQQR